jgi:glucosamine 6-phosphate synthetase-like amidotransferase/phosphosugar isomerase protein
VTNLPKISDHIDMAKLDFVIQLPPMVSVLTGLLAVPPLQMVCYFTALAKGINPDKQLFDGIDFAQSADSISFQTQN